jgi:NAD(P)-dependent dehydrogenase (short-subunit alcohol dehydrogenase family)
MESDLGIDSIKRVEILAAVQEAVPGLPELDNEQLTALRTLADVVDHLGGMASSPTATRPAQAEPVSPAPVATPTAIADPAEIPRRVVEVRPAPEGSPFAPGRVGVVLDGLGVGTRLIEALGKLGVDAVPVEADWLPVNGDTPDSIVHLASIGADGDDLVRAVIHAFELARAVGPRTLFATVSALGGTFGVERLVADPLSGALAGLAKTLDLEWEDSRCLAVDLDADALDADALAREVTTDRGVVEVGLSGPVWPMTLEARPAALPDAGNEAPVGPGELVVVSGGARGVTAAVARQMARQWQPALLLLGRSALEEEPDWATGLAEEALMAACLQASRTKGDKPTPRELEHAVSRVLATREVQTNLDAIDALGTPVRYRSVDVRDPEAVRSAIVEAVAEWGPVRGLVHGAGVIADKRVEEKTDAQFDRVFGTKVEGWASLTSAVEPSDLRFVALFSSVAGRYGNVGQCDYAMANEVLTRHAFALSRSGVRARSFAWGPWEAGMVTPALAKQLASSGITLIPLEVGARLFCEELEHDGAAVEVVLGGSAHGGLRLAATGRVDHTLDGARDAFLRDHRIDGKPVLPAMMVLEWMADAAHSAYPSLHFHGTRDFAVLKGVVVDNGSIPVSLRWTEAEPRVPGGRSLTFELVGASGKLGPTVHYRGTVDLGPHPAAPRAFPGTNGLGTEPYPYPLEEAYRQFLFHGPRMHGIEVIEGMSDQGMVARIRTSRPESLGAPGEAWVTDVVTLDGLWQLMLLWVREKRGASALPTYLGEYNQLAPLQGELTCHLKVDHPQGTARGRFDATLVDSGGRVVATFAHGEYAASQSLNRAFVPPEA